MIVAINYGLATLTMLREVSFSVLSSPLFNVAFAPFPSSSYKWEINQAKKCIYQI